MKTIIKHLLRDADIQRFIGRQLRIGVTIAFIITLLGGIIYLIVHGSDPSPDYTHFLGSAPHFTTFGGIATGAFTLQAPQVIQLGVLVLIATPILRVFFSLFAFALERDHLYTIITTIVLAVIILNIYFGVK